MKVTTRVALGFSILLVLTVGASVYHVIQIRRLATAQRDFSSIHLQEALQGIEILRQIDLLEEYTRKLAVTRDPAYAERLVEMRDTFAGQVDRLQELEASPAEHTARRLLAQAWHRSGFAELDATGLVVGQGEEARDAATLRAAELVASLERLRVRTRRLLAAVDESIAAQVASSGEVTRRAERLSWVIALVATLVGGAVVYAVVHSLHVSLRRLVEATRTVSEGEFTVLLDATGRDEIAMLAASFNSMVRRLGELDRMKRDFLSRVSHDLKTPVVAMEETNRVLLEQVPGPLNERQSQLLELNLEASRRLSRMIGNILDLSRMRAGAMHYRFSTCDVVEIVHRVVAEFEAVAREKRIRLVTRLPARLRLRADPDRVLQLVENLVDNALAHGPPDGEVRVSARRQRRVPPKLARALRTRRRRERKAGFVLVQVEDGGPGIAADQRHDVFRPFHRVDTDAERRGSRQGVGLGLAICREICEAHGGAIAVADRSGGGTVFSVLLPERPRPDAPPAHERSGAEEVDA